MVYEMGAGPLPNRREKEYRVELRAAHGNNIVCNSNKDIRKGFMAIGFNKNVIMS